MKQIKIIDDERIIIKNNYHNPFKSRQVWNGKHKSNNDLMTIKNYKKTIRRWQDKIYELNIDYSKCVFITLKFDDIITWDNIIIKFNCFLRDIRRKFKQVLQYLRAIEVHKYTKMFHIHLILMFEDKPNNVKDIEKFWHCGDFHIVEEIYDIYGLLEYLTLFKNGCYKDNTFTYFPNNAKIISSNFKTSQNIRNIEISQEHFEFIKHFYITKESKNKMRVSKHTYYDYLTDKKVDVIDRYYFKSTKEFIYSNFGTKEDDEIINKK